MKKIYPGRTNLPLIGIRETCTISTYKTVTFICTVIHAGASQRIFDWGVGVIDTQTHLPPKFNFSSDLGHFVLKMFENAKKRYTF